MTNDGACARPIDVATANPLRSTDTRSTPHGIAQATPPRSHSAFSIAMISRDELSQNCWPSFFS